MAIAAEMICSVRGAQRLSVELDATLRGATAMPIPIEIEDISVTGFKMLTTTELQLGELITVGISGVGMQPAIVVRRGGDSYGCRFLNVIPQTVIAPLQLGAQQTVAPFPPPFVPSAPFAPVRVEIRDQRLPVPTRLAIIAGLAVASWMILGGLVVLLF